MTDAPLISVILPCRDRPALLARALASVRAQTWPAWEALVIDDASDPALRLPCDDPRLRLIRLARNLGPADAREAGIAAARGAWVALLDSDDVWDPDKLTRQMARMAAGPPRVLVSGARVHGHGGVRRRPSRASRPGERIGTFLFLANEFAQASGILAPIEAARTAGFGGLRQYEDHLFLIRAEAAGWPVEVWDARLHDQVDDALDRSGARDDAGRARAFLAAAGPMLTPAERMGFAMRCLGPSLAVQAPARALALAAAGLAAGGPPGAALRLAARVALGPGGYAGLRRRLAGLAGPGRGAGLGAGLNAGLGTGQGAGRARVPKPHAGVKGGMP